MNKDQSIIKEVKRAPENAAILTKTIGDDKKGPFRKVNKTVISPHVLHNSSFKRARKNSDALAVLSLFPDLKLAKQILVSSILSPKDMVSVELLFKSNSDGLLSSSLSGNILELLKTHIENKYKFKNVLADILGEALFDKGSYILAVLPENAIDDFINGSRNYTTESFQYIEKQFKEHQVKILSNTGNLINDNLISITDDVNKLKMQLINQRSKSKEIVSKLNVSTEGFFSNVNDDTLGKIIFRPRSQRQEREMDMIKSSKDLRRKSIGDPLVLKLPPESVIPVFVSGNTSKHIGYFVLLDDTGNPVESPDGDYAYNALNLNNSSNGLGAMLNGKISDHFGNNNKNPSAVLRNKVMNDIYTSIVEKDIIDRLRTGIYQNDNINITSNQEVYRLMLSRSLSNKRSQLVYIPSEYITYFAFQFDDDGLGKSLLDDSAVINALRSTLMFADVVAGIKNSTGRTKVSVKVDENDTDPQETIEKMTDEIIKSRMVNMPLGVANPNDIFEYIQRIGYEWEFTGEGIVDMKIDFQQLQSSYAKVDSELKDELRAMSINALGLTTEIVDSGYNAQFAATVVANNALFSKRVINYQDKFNPLISDHIKKIIHNTEGLISEIKSMLNDNFKDIQIEIDSLYGEEFKIDEEYKKKLIIDHALKTFINELFIELPKPPSVTLSQQIQELEDYQRGLDLVLSSYIDEGLLDTSTFGKLSTNVSTVKNLIKAYFVRKWLIEKGIYSEINELLSKDKDNKLLIDIKQITDGHLGVLETVISNIYKDLSHIKRKGDKNYDTLDLEGNEDDSESNNQDDFSTDDSLQEEEEFNDFTPEIQKEEESLNNEPIVEDNQEDINPDNNEETNEKK